MLRELLDIIRDGQGYTISGLARRLDASEGLVEQMLVDLERMGHLTHAQATGGCASCPLAKICSGKTCPITTDKELLQILPPSASNHDS